MLYSVYFKSNNDLSDKLLTLDGVNSDFHGFLWDFNMCQSSEKEFLGSLSEVNFRPFNLVSEGVEQFDIKNSFVLKFKWNSSVYLLHRDVLCISQRYANNNLDVMVERSGMENYKPSMIIASAPIYCLDRGFLEGYRLPVSSFFVRKKEKNNWKDVAEFFLKERIVTELKMRDL